MQAQQLSQSNANDFDFFHSNWHVAHQGLKDRLVGSTERLGFFWTMPEPDQPRWAQAFSPDGGATWEMNWIMGFNRIA